MTMIWPFKKKPTEQQAPIVQRPDYYTFFDVETPNCHNDRICSIGLVVTDDKGVIVDKKYFLVNPESRFDEVNMQIHGIAPIDVKGAMTFPELWQTTVSKMIPLSGTVAHNATFDLTVLSKTLAAYGIETPTIDYACTLRMASSIPGIGGGRLPDVCRILGVEPPNHHMAVSDAEACMNVFWSIVRQTQSMPTFRPYEPTWMFMGPREKTEREFCDKTQVMRDFIPILDSVVSDGAVSTDEAMMVLETIAGHEFLLSDNAIKPIVPILQSAVSDGYVDEGESDELTRILSNIVNPAQNTECDVTFEGKNFVLTGTFDHGTRDEVGSYIESKGGCVLKSVTKKCNYVVIGGQGSEAYALGNYGTKVKKAMDWQAKGIPMEIVTEKDIY